MGNLWIFNVRVKLLLILVCVFISMTDAQSRITLFSGNQNCLYLNVANPVFVLMDGKMLKGVDYSVEINAGKLIKTDTCLWITPASFQTIVTVKSKIDRTITSGTFRSLSPPSPLITIDGKYAGGSIDRQALMSFSGIVPVFSQFPFPIKTRVSEYTIRVNIGTETFFFKSNNELVPDTVKLLFSKMRFGDMVSFYGFYLEPYQIVHGPIEFTVRDCKYELLNTCKALWYDLKDVAYDDNGNTTVKDSVFIPAVFTELMTESLAYSSWTNCTSYTHSCATTISYYSPGTCKAQIKYSFIGADSINVELFCDSVLIASVPYYKNVIAGGFNLFYENGGKRVEGWYKFDTIKYTDTVLSVNPITQGVDMKYSQRAFSSKTGEWKYYDIEGKLLYTRRFINGELVD